jgi:hypothetical protein
VPAGLSNTSGMGERCPRTEPLALLSPEKVRAAAAEKAITPASGKDTVGGASGANVGIGAITKMRKPPRRALTCQ